MTSTEIFAIVLYAFGAFLAIAGPLIAVVRIVLKGRQAESELTGTWSDPAIDPIYIRATARADAWWGLVEFGSVAFGVVLAAVASVALIVS